MRCRQIDDLGNLLDRSRFQKRPRLHHCRIDGLAVDVAIGGKGFVGGNAGDDHLRTSAVDDPVPEQLPGHILGDPGNAGPNLLTPAIGHGQQRDFGIQQGEDIVVGIDVLAGNGGNGDGHQSGQTLPFARQGLAEIHQRQNLQP